MLVDALLSRLDAVHQVAHGRWRARCPAHDGKNANVLSIGERSDGTVLVKCFHGCTAAEVVGAVGLRLHDVFPPVDWQRTRMHAGVGRHLKKYDTDEAPDPDDDRRASRQWAVTVPKSSGARVLYGRYALRHEAEAVAEALRAVSCPATASHESRGTP